MNIKDLFKVRPVSENPEDGYFITIGNHMASEEIFETQRKAEAAINKTNWNLVAALVYALKEAEEATKTIKENKEGE